MSIHAIQSPDPYKRCTCRDNGLKVILYFQQIGNAALNNQVCRYFESSSKTDFGYNIYLSRVVNQTNKE